jgi:hypothetical protein
MHWQTTETTGSWQPLSSGCQAASFSEMVLTAYNNMQCHDLEDHNQNIGLLNTFFFWLIFFWGRGVSLPNVSCVWNHQHLTSSTNSGLQAFTFDEL